MRKNITLKVLSLMLALIMVIGLLPATALAVETDEFTVVVSVEGLTLGQGIYVEPTAYTLTEINDLIAQEGYGPYTEETLTAAMATLAMFIDKGLEYEYTGNWEDSFYLSSIKDLDTGVVDIPAFITENGGPDNESHDGNYDEYLGEFDYSNMSGWMITVNDFMIDVGSAGWLFRDGVTSGKCEDYGNTYVVRWQFTLWGYGSDLGYSTEWNTAYWEHSNKDMLYAAYALSDDAAAKASALSVMANIEATADEIAAAEALFETASEEEDTSTDTGRTAQDVSAVLDATMAQMAATVTEPVFGTTAGEWTVLSLARGGYYETGADYFEEYYNRIVETVNETAASVTLANGALHQTKSTENSRLILALSSIGKDSTSVGDWNLIAPYEDFTWIKKQGINGPIFTLIALDTNNYQTEDTTIRQQCVDYILSQQLDDGGWALSDTTSDPDITAMALQALYNYKDQSAVVNAAEEAFSWLSSAQLDDGGYSSWGTINSESIAQVIVATTTWGINPDTDSRFVKNGSSAVDAILGYYVEDEAAFEHTSGGGTDAMATDQACYALVAYDRFINGENSLYNMSDVTFESIGSDDDSEVDSSTSEMTASLGVPAEIEGTTGTSFNAVISIDKWDNEAGYKLIDFIMTIPDGLTVTGVTAGSRLSGGEVSYNVEELEDGTGKLRVVYFDANENNPLEISGTEFPAEVFVISFQLDEDLTAGTKLDFAITGMSVKLTSDSEDEASMVIVNTTNSDGTSVGGSTGVVTGVSFSAVCLYTGDDVDLIPSTKMAVAVAVTGINNGSKLSYNDGTNEIEFKYSAEITAKTGVSTYVALVDSSIAMENFVNKNYFTITSAEAEAITFADANGDGVINAQDALAAVDAWLRKGEEPTDDAILVLNVNGDSRINTFDALGIVEAFVNSSDYNVVTKAATLATAN